MAVHGMAYEIAAHSKTSWSYGESLPGCERVVGLMIGRNAWCMSSHRRENFVQGAHEMRILQQTKARRVCQGSSTDKEHSAEGRTVGGTLSFLVARAGMEQIPAMLCQVPVQHLGRKAAEHKEADASQIDPSTEVAFEANVVRTVDPNVKAAAGEDADFPKLTAVAKSGASKVLLARLSSEFWDQLSAGGTLVAHQDACLTAVEMTSAVAVWVSAGRTERESHRENAVFDVEDVLSRIGADKSIVAMPVLM